MTLNLDDLGAVARAATPGPWEAEPYLYMADDDRVRVTSPSDGPLFNLAEGVEPVNASHIATFDPPTVLALIARLRDAERERDGARWAAGIVGDMARESSGGWQDASAELHAAQDRLREAEAVIEEVDDLVARHHLDTTVGQAVFKITGSYYKPTNPEGGNDGT
jgi:hypothetical protein